MDNNLLLNNLKLIHTTSLGLERIRNNLGLEDIDIIEYCLNKITDEKAIITKKGKNWYVLIDNIKLCINSNTYSIITAHIVTSKYKLGLLKKQDIKAVTELYISVFSQEPWNDVYESFEEVELFIKNFTKGSTYLNYVLYKENEIVALSLGMKKPYLKGIEYYIDSYCVNYEMQGLGIGSEFLRLIEEANLKIGIDSILLNTERGYDSEKFYVKNGFRQLSDLIVLVK